MKYILETSEPLSEAIRELIKEKVPYAHVESIKPLIVDEDKFDYSGKMVKYAEQYAKDNFEDVDVIESYDIEEAYLAGYRKALGYE